MSRHQQYVKLHPQFPRNFIVILVHFTMSWTSDIETHDHILFLLSDFMEPQTTNIKIYPKLYKNYSSVIVTAGLEVLLLRFRT